MANSSALSISDIPFVYSFINILYIWMFGLETISEGGTTTIDVSRLYVVGLIAGLLGTFVVFWHPIQWFIDDHVKKRLKDFSTYFIEIPSRSPENYHVIIEPWINLSLQTPAIKYLKDKLSSMAYFLIILVTLFLALINVDFQKTIHLGNSPYLFPIQFGIFVMYSGACYFIGKQYVEFRRNLRISGAFYFLTEYFLKYNDEANFIKAVIDLNDWVTAKKMIDHKLGLQWGNLISYSTNVDTPKSVKRFQNIINFFRLGIFKK